MTFLIVILFLIQIIVAYFLVLLYMKVSKFDDLEKKQRKLMQEMDDSIVAYLAELKDENTFLIEKLAQQKTEMIIQTDEESPNPEISAKATLKESQLKSIMDVPMVPVNVALKSYKNAKSIQGAATGKLLEQEPEDDRTRALELFRNGHSIESIAKKLEKGKTEVELMLKFR